MSATTTPQTHRSPGSTRHVLGLDVGGTNARAALLRVATSPDSGADCCRAEIVADARVRIRDDTSPERVIAAISELGQRCAELGGVELAEVAGLGIGMAGQLTADGRTVINAPNLGWRDVALAAQLETVLPVSGPLPVRVVNDLSAIVWGEYRCGGGRGYDDLLAVYVGTGIGSGLVLRGALYEGATGVAGELGHAKLPGLEAVCGCGQVGCVEALAGGRSLERRIAADVASGHADDLVAWLRAEHALPSSVSPAEVEMAARAGVGYADALWGEVSAALGDVLAGALALLNPSGLLLGGGVLENAPALRRRVVSRLAQRTVEVAWREVTVATPQLGDDAGVMGAGLLLSEWL